MLIAGETSGDILCAELVRALRQRFVEVAPISSYDYQPLAHSLEPRFFGAGGPAMAAAGVELAFDLTAHSIIGISGVLRHYFKFRRLFHKLLRLSFEREPDAIICIDFSGFNRRFAHAVKAYVRGRLDWFHDWNPALIQYVSPQVWASRPGRARQIEQDYDLLLSTFPFESAWYARRAPRLPVQFVGNPIVDRYAHNGRGTVAPGATAPPAPTSARPRTLLLLPGSRAGELARHLTVMVEATKTLRARIPGLRARMVLPTESLAELARRAPGATDVEMIVGGLRQALLEADAAIACTGTVTLECAYFGVPTVTLYKTSLANYEIGKRVIAVKWLTMPNILADEEIFPEFVQGAATAGNLARAAGDLLTDEAKRARVKARLEQLVASLGEPGAAHRAATAILAQSARAHPQARTAHAG